jgi:uncharacterized protein
MKKIATYFLGLTTFLWSSNLLLAQETKYRCPPCVFDCHHLEFNGPGLCTVCGMELIEVSHFEFEGYSNEEISIASDTILLNAAFYAPENKEIRGVLVVVHGSSPSTYEDVSYYTKIGARLNMAVLAYDKRGCGKSGGEYQNFDVENSSKWFNILANDVLACVSWLKSRPELKGIKLGLIGGSQAGWIMPLAASKNSDIEYMIIGEGVSVSAGEEHYFSQLTEDGGDSGISIGEADAKLKNFTGNKGYDPRELLRSLKSKCLWILGTSDPVIPVDATLRELKRLNNENFTLQILQNGNHDFVNIKTGESYDLIEFIKPWLINQRIIN